MKKRAAIIIILLTIICVGLGVLYFLVNSSPITYYDSNPTVEISTKFDASKNIKKVKSGKIKDVKVNDKKLNTKKLGTYKVYYTLDDYKDSIDVEVVDTKKPKFDIVEQSVLINSKVKASDFVANIKDETKTKTYFDKKYKFNKLGKKKIKIVVEDEGHNKTIKEITIKVVNDKIPPEFSGINDLSVIVDSSADYYSGVSVSDNVDKDIKFKVDSSDVILNKIGIYYAVYSAEDSSGNVTEVKRKILVVQKNIGSSTQSDEKVVYLTFDDGPSNNTAKVLAILDKYNAKATFFVTGCNQAHNNLIAEAHKAGHTIGLHTYTHDYARVYASDEAYFNDLNQVGDMVKSLIGYTPKYIRFPGGSSNTISAKYSVGIMSRLTQEVLAKGYQYYDWNSANGDAMGNNISTSALIQNATHYSGNNLVMLMHDSETKGNTVEALPAIIEYYLSNGYVFKGIDDNTYVAHQNVAN